MSGFASEYLNDGASENYVTPPRPGVTTTGKPFSMASNEILRRTLEARDATIAIAADLATLEATLLAAAAASDISSYPPRP